ncbi:MAG TPA: choice-of-anchor J domain-containing protein [Thermoanaerobaculia bacterium]|jgi:hypothetical protein
MHTRIPTVLSPFLLFSLTLLALPLGAQQVVQSRGVDARVDYAALTRLGPWDDRNYRLTRDDLALLAPDEAAQTDPIPAFFRVELRRSWPTLRRRGPAQYPRSALQIFRQLYTGYLVAGKHYRRARREDGRFRVLVTPESEIAEPPAKFLDGEARVTSPQGAAESAVKISPADTNRVIAGSNGPGNGQRMHYSTDGGATWNVAAALPQGGTCCDPTVDWKSDGSLAYAATLGNCTNAGCAVWFYRSNDGGQTWNGLESVTPGDPRRELTTSGSDKEFLHVDKAAASPHRDNVYLTWHDDNVLQFARSTDDGHTWSKIGFTGEALGIGSDVTTDGSGAVYYFWPAFDTRQIVLKKSTNGGASFAAGTTVVASTEASFTFPVPSMDTREVFVYVAADADLSSGPFGGSVYVAWTDSTAATGGSAAGNHARVRVAFSRNGGASWSVVTAHETADAASVDRYHPWLAVGPDGRVHVAFYDTRRSANRAAVDLFYTSSADGGQSFASPVRLTAQASPKIDDSFELGDYNGLDAVMSDVIAVFTDNRPEGGGGGDSVDVYAAGFSVDPGDGGGGDDGGDFSESFEGGAGGWTTSGLWHLVTDGGCASPGYSSPTRAMYYGQDAGCDYDTGAATSGNLISPQIQCGSGATLTFQYFRQVEETVNDAYETTSVAASVAGQSTWTTLWSRTSLQASENAWTSSGAISLAAFAGQAIELRFRFDSVDEIENGFVGWLVDDVVVDGCGSGGAGGGGIVIFADGFESGNMSAWTTP